MTAPEREAPWKRARAAFEKAFDLDPSEQSAFLLTLQGEDEEVCRRVRELLEADEVRDEFLEPILPVEQAGSLEGKELGGFKVLRVLAEGGMGTVYLAEQEHPRRRVALKAMRSGLTSPQSRRRFQYEGELLAKLRHPNIAQVLGAGVLEVEGAFGLPWLALELVEGARPLSALGSDPAIPLKRRLRLFLTTCNAVHHAHLRGVLHRDLKGANVLVDGEGHVKVIDFGIARPMDQDLPSVTRSGEVVGTLASMAPEQIAGRANEVDARIDVYALGVLLHELVCGAPPYDLSGLSLPQAARVIEYEEPTPPSRQGKGLPRELDWIAAKALAKAPTDRYGSVSELSADIERLLDDQPVQAGPPSATYRLRKYYRRNRLTVIAFASVFLALVAGFIGTLAGLVEARAATQDAREAETAARSSEEDARIAENQARTSEMEARTEALLSGELFDFFQEGLSSPDPSRRGRDLTMVDFLKRTAQDVDQRFGSHPLVAGLLHRTIGRSLHGLGEDNAALDHLQRAVEALESVDESSEALQAQRELAKALADLSVVRLAVGDLDGAEQALQSSQETLGDLGRLDEEQLARIQAKRGLILLEFGRTTEAEESLRGAIEHLPKDDPDIFAAATALGGVMQREGRFGEAIEVYQSSLDDMGGVGERPLAIMLMNNLATALQQNGQPVDAMATLEKLLPEQESLLGLSHPDVIGCRSNLASLYFLGGKKQEALTLWRESLSALEGELPDEHPLMQTLHVNIGVTEIDFGRPEDGATLLRSVWEMRKKLYGPDEERTLKVQYELARALHAGTHYDEATELSEDAAYRFLTGPGEFHETLPLCEYMNGNIAETKGNRAEALEIYQILRDDIAAGRRKGLRVPQQELENKIRELSDQD